MKNKKKIDNTRIYLCKNCGERKEAHREFSDGRFPVINNDGNSIYSFYVCDNFEFCLEELFK
jgi:hypothetical protein